MNKIHTMGKRPVISRCCHLAVFQVTLPDLVLSFLICKVRGWNRLGSLFPASSTIPQCVTLSLVTVFHNLVQSSVWPHLFSDITPCPKHNVVNSYMGSRDVPGNTVSIKREEMIISRELDRLLLYFSHRTRYYQS